MKKSNMGFLFVHDTYIPDEDATGIDLDIVETLNEKGHYGVRARVIKNQIIPDTLMEIRNKAHVLRDFCNDVDFCKAYVLVGLALQPYWVKSESNFAGRYLTAIAIELEAIGFEVVFCVPNIKTETIPKNHHKWLNKLRRHIIGNSAALGYETLKIDLFAPKLWLSVTSDSINNMVKAISDDIEAGWLRADKSKHSTREENYGKPISRTFVLRG